MISNISYFGMTLYSCQCLINREGSVANMCVGNISIIVVMIRAIKQIAFFIDIDCHLSYFLKAGYPSFFNSSTKFIHPSILGSGSL